MGEKLAGLITRREGSRAEFIQARQHRDLAARHYDSVVDGGATVTQPAWDAFSAKQLVMDLAGDNLYLACGAVTDYVLLDV
jgi:hypothetical protein